MHRGSIETVPAQVALRSGEAPPGAVRPAPDGAGTVPPAGRVLPAAPPAAGIAVDRFTMALRQGLGLLSMIYQSKSRLRYWWAERHGRAAEVEAEAHGRVRAWSREVLENLGCRVEVEGLEHVPAEGPLIVMANHQSSYDIPLLLSCLWPLPGFVAKRELFRIPGLAWWMGRIHCVPLDRSDVRAGGRMLQTLAEDIRREGRRLIIFPEGTRTRDPAGALLPFRQGSLRLAAQADLPILPVSLDGTRYLNQPAALARTRAGGRLVRVRMAPVVRPGALRAREARAFVEALRATILGNWEAIRVDWPASPAS